MTGDWEVTRLEQDFPAWEVVRCGLRYKARRWTDGVILPKGMADGVSARVLRNIVAAREWDELLARHTARRFVVTGT